LKNPADRQEIHNLSSSVLLFGGLYESWNKKFFHSRFGLIGDKPIQRLLDILSVGGIPISESESSAASRLFHQKGNSNLIQLSGFYRSCNYFPEKV